ncbi:MAG TPA: hypothetical protein PKK33_02625 [Candidatus Cloacimonadota bacterium]|nr:hypothetical protein [Candidatus Cloacimonadota bacterium]
MMSDESKDIQGTTKPKAKPQPKTDDDAPIVRKTRFSLLELTMILMIVGIILVFWLPMRADKIMAGKVAVAIDQINQIAKEDNEFKTQTTFYLDDINQMNIYKKLDQRYFTYALTDSACVIATSTPAFGVKDAKIIFRLPTGPFEVGTDDVSQKYIDQNWLP